MGLLKLGKNNEKMSYQPDKLNSKSKEISKIKHKLHTSKPVPLSYFSTKTYVVGAKKNCLNEMVLLSTQKTCLNRVVRIFLQFYAQKVSLSELMKPYKNMEQHTIFDTYHIGELQRFRQACVFAKSRQSLITFAHMNLNCVRSMESSMHTEELFFHDTGQFIN